MAEAVPETADYSSSSGEDSDLDTDLAVVAASTLRLDPYISSGDQDECQEVRMALDCNSRWEDLFNLWKETIAYKFPEDEEKQARLTLALRREVETWQSAYQDKANQEKEQKDKNKKKKKKPQKREVTFPEGYDWDKAYFVRATVEGETDMCSPRNYTHVGVPLIGEDQQPYRRPEWEIPPKAAPIPGAQPKSEPTIPVPMEEPTDELIEVSSDSSAGTLPQLWVPRNHCERPLKRHLPMCDPQSSKKYSPQCDMENKGNSGSPSALMKLPLWSQQPQSSASWLTDFRPFKNKGLSRDNPSCPLLIRWQNSHSRPKQTTLALP